MCYMVVKCLYRVIDLFESHHVAYKFVFKSFMMMKGVNPW